MKPKCPKCESNTFDYEVISNINNVPCAHFVAIIHCDACGTIVGTAGGMGC